MNTALEAAIGGTTVGQTVEGRERYAIQVRYARDFRDDPEAVGRTLVPTASGALVPLRELADLDFTHGPDMVRSEAGKLVGLVAVDVAGRPIVDYVNEAREVVAKRVELPAGTRIAWVGQFEYFERAKARLQIVLPITLALVALLLYLNTRSAVETAMVMLAVPFSLIGAVWLLYVLGYNLSVAVWVGIIALAGLDAQTGVVMLLYLSLAWRERVASGHLRSAADLEGAIVEGAARRIRPKLMTVATMMLGLVPAAVEQWHRRRRHEAHRGPHGRRPRQLVRARAARLPRALRVLEGTRARKGGNAMKQPKFGAALFTCAALLAASACGGRTETGQGEGIVRAVDPVANRVTLDHGDIPGMMKAMKMDFPVADASLLDGLAPGDEVRFSVREADGRYTVIAIEELKP